MRHDRGKRLRWIKRRCIVCGNLFMTSRRDSELCSPRCRKARSREQAWAALRRYFRIAREGPPDQ